MTKLETIGDRIRKARNDAKLTQQQLGDIVGVSSSAVAQWESGNTKAPIAENLFKIARATRKSAEWLITGKGGELPQNEIAEAINALPDDNPQQALDFIQYLFSKPDNLIASDKVAHYFAVIEDFKSDLLRRKKEKK